MAEYYPLLAKAIAGLPNSTPEARRAVYERARKALLAQLQNLQPPVPEADVARETRALDSAVARIEAELAAPNGSPKAVPRIESLFGTAPRAAPKIGDKPLIFARPAATERRSKGAATDPGPVADLSSETKDRRTDAEHNDVQSNESSADYSSAPSMRSELLRPEVARPYAPRPEPDDAPQSRRLWIVIIVVVLIVGGVAAAAWKLRDRPEDFAAFKPAQSETNQGGGKIVQRIGGLASQESSTTPASESPTPAQTSAPAPAPAPAPAAAAAPAQTEAAAHPAQTTADSSASVPVAYRAAMLVEAPEEPNKVKTYVGTVIWRLENVSTDSGQPPGTAVRADVDIPDDQLKASLEIQKNTDPGLSASHTITIVFTIAPGSPTGSIKQISLPQLRAEDSPNGEALRGSLVPIMANSFLIGLNRGDAEAANIELIKQREWFDIPILLGNGRVAKLTFEKNASGDRAIDDALASWQAQQ
jgi:hypothetical protein